MRIFIKTALASLLGIVVSSVAAAAAVVCDYAGDCGG